MSLKVLSKIRSLIRDNKAIAAIEFALVIPVFLLFFVGIMEVFMILFGNTMINNMGSQATRAAMIGCVDGEFQGGACNGNYQVDIGKLRRMIRTETAGLVKACDTAKLRISVGPVGGTAGSDLGQGGQLVQMQIQYDWDVLIPMLKSLGKLINFQTTFVARNEQFGNMGVVRSTDRGC